MKTIPDKARLHGVGLILAGISLAVAVAILRIVCHLSGGGADTRPEIARPTQAFFFVIAPVIAICAILWCSLRSVSTGTRLGQQLAASRRLLLATGALVFLAGVTMWWINRDAVFVGLWYSHD